MKNNKPICLEEKDEAFLELEVKKSSDLIMEFKPHYTKFMKKLIKQTPQTRVFTADTLLNAIVHDSRMPPYILLGLLEKLKSDVIRKGFGENVPIENLGNNRGYIG